jgi:endo-1,4-beta-xylanase
MRGERLFLFLFLLFNISLLTPGCIKNAAPATNTSNAVLKSTASFPMGSAVTTSGIQTNTNYAETLVSQYNSMTADWEMKFAEVEPAEGIYNYSPGDFLVSFAAQHHIRMHGHNLIWHQALPDWVLNFQGDSAAWENLFKTHIQNEAAHYKGEVASWDVVNEALRDDNGALRNLDVTPNDGTGSIWRQHLGPDYIARAFIYAHEADPNALLFYNDYGQEWGGLKLDSMVALLTNLKSRGIPVSGVGMQMHITINSDTAGISAGLKALAATGLLVHVSELDIQVNPGNSPTLVYTPALQQQQAALYRFVAESYRVNVPPAQRYGITTWEFCDADSWIRSEIGHRDWPLPFDSLYQEKPAYFGLLKGLTN